MTTPLARYFSAAAACAILLSCGGSGVEPRIAGPGTIAVSTAPSATSTVGTSAGIFGVRVIDTEGGLLAGASVSFTATGGATVTPASAITDATGIAQTTVSLGTLAGPVTVTGTVTGTLIKVDALIAATAGAAATVVTTTSPNATSVVGSSAGIFAVRVVDANANAVSGSSVTFTTTGGAVVSPSIAITNSLGIAQTTVTLGPTPGAVTVSASLTGTALRTDAAITAISVPCTALAVGATITYSGTGAGCVRSPSAGAEYTIIAYNSTMNGSNVLTATITGSGLAAAPTTVRVPDVLDASRMASVSQEPSGPVQDESFHLRMMSRVQAALQAKIPTARAHYAARTARRAPGARLSAIPTAPVKGQIISMNVGGEGDCTPTEFRGMRVAGVSARSVVLADTLNPPGGFTDAEYQNFADRFDALVYPLGTENFGAPSDIDGNGRVGILFTTAVNQLTPPNSGSFVGGYFTARDLFPATDPNPAFNCPGSNEGEMFYMLAPDPTGAVNNNKFRKGFVDTITTSTIAHEFQHLINASRRLYINSGASSFEVVWLSEGLSHVAEELLYYRETGRQPRQNLTGSDVTATRDLFRADNQNNFGRLAEYLKAPGRNSPIMTNDSLATRGATWSFLRYAVDQVGGNETAIWTRFGNSVVTGLTSVQQALQRSPTPLLRTWALANYFDDLGVVADVPSQHVSWNYRNIYGTVLSTMRYPLLTSPMNDNVAADVFVSGGSASYYRFAVGADRDAILSFSAGGAVPSASLEFNVVRTR